MNELIEIGSLTDYREHISQTRDDYIFRGLKKESYKLIPKIGRYLLTHNIKKENLLEIEKEIFDLFKLQASEFVTLPEENLYILALGQHHGLVTRLLDWTLDPFVALYFSVEGSEEHNSIVYAYKHNYLIRTKMKSGDEYIDIDDDIFNQRYDDVFFHPPYFSKRFSIQSAILHIFQDPTIEFSPTNITKYIIKKGNKSQILEYLKLYGFTRKKLFPGLDELSGHLNNTKLESKFSKK